MHFIADTNAIIVDKSICIFLQPKPFGQLLVYELLLMERPIIPINTANCLPNEKFLHETLRPVLKLLNNHLIIITQSVLNDKNISIQNFSELLKKRKIIQILNKDITLKNALANMAIGYFNETELSFYLENKKEVNKRLHALIQQRILSQIEEFE